MNSNQDEITTRHSIWLAMSDLFLDTDISESYEYIARQCAASTFSMEELEQILVLEVAPVCAGNLLSVAGVWDGFDEQWLIQEITYSRQRNFPWQRFTKWLLNCAFHGYIRRHWQKIEQMIISTRKET